MDVGCLLAGRLAAVLGLEAQSTVSGRRSRRMVEVQCEVVPRRTLVIVLFL